MSIRDDWLRLTPKSRSTYGQQGGVNHKNVSSLKLYPDVGPVGGIIEGGGPKEVDREPHRIYGVELKAVLNALYNNKQGLKRLEDVDGTGTDLC